GIPNTGGLTYREISAIAKYIGKNCNVVGMDLVEYNSTKDIDNKTAELAIELTAKIFGSDYSPYTQYMEKNKI
ncbi:MAG: arginase, partial [Candidatus Levybacteria bacterium CG_4_10_14_0_2_um_filter_35_8]